MVGLKWLRRKVDELVIDICQADKGGAILIVPGNYLEEKIEAKVKDTEKYEALKSDIRPHLYDTLIEQMSVEEIEAVLAHEVGHYKMGHIPKRLIMSFFTGLLGFGLIGYLLQSEWFYMGIGLDASLTSSLGPLIVGLSLILGFLTYWLTPLSNFFSRKHEFEADNFAKNSVGGADSLISALRKLYVKNLSHPLPHPLMAGFHYSHPTLLERENALRNS